MFLSLLLSSCSNERSTDDWQHRQEVCNRLLCTLTGANPSFAEKRQQASQYYNVVRDKFEGYDGFQLLSSAMGCAAEVSVLVHRWQTVLMIVDSLSASNYGGDDAKD